MTDRVFMILASLFVASLTIAAVLASKVVMFAGVVFPAGIIAYSVTFLMSDTISEIWGRKAANTVVISGFISLVVVFVLIRVSIVMPAAPFWQMQDAFSGLLGSSSRIIIASLTAYLISQYHDVWLYHLLKNKTSGRFLWLRNNASTAVSQLMDSVIFIVIAFYGVMPIVPLILGQWLIKLVIAALDTPFVYLLVNLLRSKGYDKAEVF
jgi:uncharacterized integral membrane protein (TIGR00697 family)